VNQHPIVAPDPYFIVRSRKMKEKKTRFIGIDLGKRTYEMAITGKGIKVVMSNGKTSVEGRVRLYKKLHPTDRIALEAGTLAFIMAKELEAAVGCKVYVLNPYRLSVIYKSMKKTDKEDALKLAHIIEDFQEERLPLVNVPSDKEMERRKILSGYRRAQQGRGREINRLHALFVNQGITTVVKKDLATAEQRQDLIKVLKGLDLEDAEYLIKIIDHHEARIENLEMKMKKESEGNEMIQRLQEIPGVGLKVSFAISAHIDAGRFENAGQLSNYLGMVPRVYMSGDTVRYGNITKRGNSYIRALLVQASWALIRSRNGGKLKERYEYMTVKKSISKKKAIVAIARRLAEMMYVLMRDGTRYRTMSFIRNNKMVTDITGVKFCA